MAMQSVWNFFLGGAGNVAGGGAPVIDPAIAASTARVQELVTLNQTIGLEPSGYLTTTVDQQARTNLLDANRVTLISHLKQQIRVLEEIPQAENGALQKAQSRQRRKCNILKTTLGPAVVAAGEIAARIYQRGIANANSKLIQTYNAKNPVGALWSLVPSAGQIAQYAASAWQQTKTYLDCPPPPPSATFQPALQKTFQEELKTALETALKNSEQAAAAISSRLVNFLTSESAPNTNLTREEIQTISQDIFERVTRKFAHDYFRSPEGIPGSLNNVTREMLLNTTQSAFQNISDAFVKRSTIPQFKQNLACRTFSIINSGLEDASWIDKIKDLTVENIWNYISTSEIWEDINFEITNYPTKLMAALQQIPDQEWKLSAGAHIALVLEAMLFFYTLSRIPFSDRVVKGTLKFAADAPIWTGQKVWQGVKGLFQGATWCYNHPKTALATLGYLTLGAATIAVTAGGTSHYMNQYSLVNNQTNATAI